MRTGSARVLGIAAAAVLSAHAQVAGAQATGSGQAYPARPLKLIIPFPAGGPTDILGRLVAQRLGESWGHNVMTDNRPGGGGMIGAMLAVKSPPDGYTLYLGGITTLSLAPSLQRDIQDEPLRDFVPVTHATSSPIMPMAHPSLPVRSLKEFIALAKARPGEINYATSGPGGSGHLAGELFKSMTGTNIVHVPYRGQPPALNDLLAGQVQTLFGTLLASVTHVRGGKLRGIAITGKERSIAAPETPTFPEAGLPGYDASSWNGFCVPAGTPQAIVAKLNVEIARILRTPNVLDRLAGDGAVPVASTPEQFAAYIKAEQVKWGKVIREAGIRID